MRCARGGRRKRRQRGDDHEIPFDLIIEILTRLPVTSLMRFKCVSKLWSCLTLSRYFSNLYLMVASSPPIRLYMSLVSEYAELLGFIEHGGKPAIFDFTHIRETGVSELWVLEVDGGTWSRKSLVLKPCQRHLVDDIINIMDLRVRGTGQDNEVILALPCPCYLLY
ncbi:unnamed protein product [Brassica oleracea]